MMREFNKLFLIALPRCATVSMSHAVGHLGIATAHLGKIFAQRGVEHHDPHALLRIHQQISLGEYHLDILESCRGLADYPACSLKILKELDKAYPGSLFINVRRDTSIDDWLQSIERQFIGLELVNASRSASELQRDFLRVMLDFRALTFGQRQFEAERFRRAYYDYQAAVSQLFSQRSKDYLVFHDVSELAAQGFPRLCEFLHIPHVDDEFPFDNHHSQAPKQAFEAALATGQIASQTGIEPSAAIRES